MLTNLTKHRNAIAAVLAMTLSAAPVAAPVAAQERPPGVSQISSHMGQMATGMEVVGDRSAGDLEVIRFEPFQLVDEMFLRDDVVFVMRHGPTDWNKLDLKNVAPEDCENQRILSEQGGEDMIELGIILASNNVLPSEIIVSQWCRNQQTVEKLLEGFDMVDPDLRRQIPVETNADVNLLLALQGAPNVSALRELVTDWDGSDGEGPRLIITHFTNIEELTQFTVYEGEILVLDPKRENRVLGYLRLQSARPDIGHFNVE